ncbi:MAG: Lrp/AsnC family transcriptional regulator [Thermoplasmata archaeon]|nr:MAG: Lrp/AsnC family transcriptional regulator [Thermoplasmata archaeon]
MAKKRTEEIVSVEEERILELLQKDARMPIAQIARKVGLSENTVKKRVKKLKEDGYIHDFTLLLNPKKFGKNVITIFMISTELNKVKDCTKELTKLSQIIDIYFTTGNYSIIAIGLFDDDDDLNDFLVKKFSKLPINHYNVVTVLEKIKEGFFEI